MHAVRNYWQESNFLIPQENEPCESGAIPTSVKINVSEIQIFKLSVVVFLRYVSGSAIYSSSNMKFSMCRLPSLRHCCGGKMNVSTASRMQAEVPPFHLCVSMLVTIFIRYEVGYAGAILPILRVWVKICRTLTWDNGIKERIPHT